MMYYWVVEYPDYRSIDGILSYREELVSLRQHHIVVKLPSCSFKSSAQFALGRQISTEKTWRDLNDALVTYLQSQSVQDDKESPALGINIGVDNSVPSWGNSDLNIFSRDDQGLSVGVIRFSRNHHYAAKQILLYPPPCYLETDAFRFCTASMTFRTWFMWVWVPRYAYDSSRSVRSAWVERREGVGKGKDLMHLGNVDCIRSSLARTHELLTHELVTH